MCSQLNKKQPLLFDFIMYHSMKSQFAKSNNVEPTEFITYFSVMVQVLVKVSVGYTSIIPINRYFLAETIYPTTFS